MARVHRISAADRVVDLCERIVLVAKEIRALEATTDRKKRHLAALIARFERRQRPRGRPRSNASIRERVSGVIDRAPHSAFTAPMIADKLGYRGQRRERVGPMLSWLNSQKLIKRVGLGRHQSVNGAGRTNGGDVPVRGDRSVR